jgi:selenocysteine lyase/cysteine desulfurase
MAIHSEQYARCLSTPLTIKHTGEQTNRNGNFYALSVTERLGLEEKGGLLRVGLVHYNTQEEIDRLMNALLTATRS